jgi:hypothetical protein
MHACQLVEWSALLAANSRFLLGARSGLRSEGLEQYWVASKCRLDRWGMALTLHANGMRSDTAELWPGLKPVLEEILVSEILTRVWTAICCASDQGQLAEESDAGPVARNVLAGHMEASSRAMKVVARGDDIPVEEAVALNRLRRTNERWNDMLLGLCGKSVDLREFAHDEKRVGEFSRPAGTIGTNHVSGVLAAIRMAYRGRRSRRTDNASTNRRIVGGMLACFGPEHFGSTGTYYPQAVARLYEATTDTRCTLDQLIETGTDLDFDPAKPFSTRRINHTDRM